MPKRKEKTPEPSRINAVGDPDTLEEGKGKVENWVAKTESKAHETALKRYTEIQKAYDNKEEQGNLIEEYWNIYNANPDENQQYTGNSQCYIPAVRDAVNARTKRALKQLFPANNKHVDGLSSDGKTPYTQLSLLEHYIRTTQLRSIVRTDLIAGDVTGQWNLYFDWSKCVRNVTKLIKKNPIVESHDGEDITDLEIEDPTGEEVEDTETDEVMEEGPEITDFATQDLAVIPPTCSDLQKAKIVCLKMRMSPQMVQEFVDEGVFVLPRDTDIDQFCKPDQARDRKSPPKKATREAGIKTEGTNRYAMIYCAYMKLDFDAEDGRLEEGIVYYSGQDEICGIIKNPLWSGKRPIISQPVERIQGSFFGKSKIEPVKFLQWNLCDFWNMGQDSAMYSLLPVFAVDPLKTPQWASMTLGLAAMWPIAPADIKAIPFPQLYKEAAPVCDMLKRQIWESMDVNEMMMGRMPQGRKNNQLMGSMQQEQMTNIIDHASRYEEVVLNPLCEMLFEFDQQFRTDEIMIEQRGEIGVKASVEMIPVPQWGERIFFRWLGTEYSNEMQRMQQQIGFMNVLKGIPPQMLNGRQLDLTPILERGTENIFGPEMAPKILIDKRNQFFIEPDIENQILHNQMPVDVHEADDDPKHLQSHMMAANMAGDPLGLFKGHMQAHMMQMQKKREMQQAQQGGAPGGPGGAGPGVAGAPRPGALPAPGGPRPAQNPPGAIHADQMASPNMPGRG